MLVEAVKQMLQKALPDTEKVVIDELAYILSQISGGKLSADEANEILQKDSVISSVFSALSGEILEDNSGSIIEFGEGNYFGSVAFRDVVGGSIYHVSLTTNHINAEYFISDRILDLKSIGNIAFETGKELKIIKDIIGEITQELSWITALEKGSAKLNKIFSRIIENTGEQKFIGGLKYNDRKDLLVAKIEGVMYRFSFCLYRANNNFDLALKQTERNLNKFFKLEQQGVRADSRSESILVSFVKIIDSREGEILKLMQDIQLVIESLEMIIHKSKSSTSLQEAASAAQVCIVENTKFQITAKETLNIIRLAKNIARSLQRP